MRAKVQGDVELEAVILANGTVGDMRIVKSLDDKFGLDAEAIKAAKQWFFKPGVDRDGKAQPVIVTLIPLVPTALITTTPWAREGLPSRWQRPGGDTHRAVAAWVGCRSCAGPPGRVSSGNLPSQRDSSGDERPTDRRRGCSQPLPFPGTARIVTNNAASTQPPRELLALYDSLAPVYENVHRGQSTASQNMTAAFEAAYDTIAGFINAPSRRNIAICRNTTEAHNAVMYTLFTDFRDGDNVVTTLMEHNSNYVPWYAMCREILPKFGRHVAYRLVRFDPVTGALDLDHLRSLIDHRTKLVCCTGASNFFGTKNPLSDIRAMASASGYVAADRRAGFVSARRRRAARAQHAGGRRQALDVDYLSFSFHKMLAPFGVGVLYGKEHLLEASRPFLYGGDMIAHRQVFPDRVAYNDLPWKFGAGTPNILGTVISAQALRLLVDLALSPRAFRFFGTDQAIDARRRPRGDESGHAWTRRLTARALARLADDSRA